MAYIDTVKQWFETGDKPTQAQFWTLFSYLWFTDQPISLSAISGLSDLIASKTNQTDFVALQGGTLLTYTTDGNFPVPPGYLLEKLIILPIGVDMNIQLGQTPGGNEISEMESVPGDVGVVYDLNIFCNTNPETIYFTGISGTTKIIFFMRKVNLS